MGGGRGGVGLKVSRGLRERGRGTNGHELYMSVLLQQVGRGGVRRSETVEQRGGGRMGRISWVGGRAGGGVLMQTGGKSGARGRAGRHDGMQGDVW